MSDNSSFINPCVTTEVSLVLFSAMFITNLLLLPVFILVFYLGFQQWRQQRSASPAAGSHSNLFTYHSIALQLNVVLGLILVFYSGYNNLLLTMVVGLSLLSVTSAGQTLFHMLTCTEHYLAVVHPITYLHLKQAGEARIRHVCAGCVWLLSIGWLGFHFYMCISNPQLYFITYCFTVAVSFTVVCFCSISVLCALRRPGPGEGGGNRAQADQSKRRAFLTTLIILGVLLLGFVGNVIVNTTSSSDSETPVNHCVLILCSLWLNLPSNLVLPVLFLHRAGKLKYCKQKNLDNSCRDKAEA